MSAPRALALLALATFPAACASSLQDAPKPANELERALYFVEQPRTGARLPISGESTEPGAKVTRVPTRAEVDVNSRVAVRVSQEELIGGTGSPVSREKLADLNARQERLTRVLEQYAAWLGQRGELLDAYARVLELPLAERADPGHPARARFNAALEANRNRFFQFGTQVMAAYQGDASKARALDQIANSPDLAGLEELIAADVADFQARIDAEIAAREASLRLEAFVLSEGKEPHAIHLEGYDQLDQQRVRLDDARAFDISALDLASMVRMTTNVAAAAKRVDEENASYAEAFGAISPRVAERLEELDQRIDELRRALGADALRDRFDATRRSLETFFDTAVEAANEEQRRAADGARERLLDEFQDVRRLLRDVDAVSADVRGLREAFRNPRRGNLVATLGRASQIWSRIEEIRMQAKALAGTSEARDALVARLATVLDESLESLDDAVRERWLQAWNEGDAKTALEGWSKLYDDARSLLADAAAILGIARPMTLPADASVAEAVEVPVSEVADTLIDLRRTPRRVGDAVVLRATLTEKGKVLRRRDFDFDVVRYGFHDALVPSVVLVRPDQITGADEDFEFAPSITWSHTYYPRPGDDAWFDHVCRTMRPSLGVHAILLDFDDDQATEIGLGATLAIWGERLQLGAGVNLMAGGDDEGRYYYFVGSSLIPLLQALESGGDSE